MDFFGELHRDTADLHYEGKSCVGNIVIDAAYLPFPFGYGYEVMTMTPRGKEIECVRCDTLDEARIAWHDMFKKYVQTKATTKKEG